MPLKHQGVAWQYKFPEKRLKVQALRRATWCRRRSTPALIVTWACHLKTQAWHANTREGQSKAGRATWCRRRGTPALILTWACHLKTQAWHANTREG
ncbi:hypothetical protein AHAS_Ahas13G0288000 [Arachis hypogaea]